MSTWMNLEGTMLSEISQRKIPYDLTYMWNLKNKKTKKLIQKEIRFVVTKRGCGERDRKSVV